MRLTVAALAVWYALAAIPAAAQTSFPYKAYVTAKGVYVRSGPGEPYYPTEKLQAGAEVEVYRRDPGGWLAIRPLSESYSWVSGRFLKLRSDGLAEVTTQDAVARVGSQFSDIREVVQVRLDRGEVVELKGTKQVEAGSGAGTWYKIAPPSGEFRWIQEKYVDAAKAARPSAPVTQVGGSDGQAAPAEHVGPAGEDAGERTTLHTDDAPLQPPRAGAPRLPTGSVRQLSSEGFQDALDGVNTELSVMLAEEPTVWYCDELRGRCEVLLSQAETALERGRSRVLLNRIAQADGVKRRFESGGDAAPTPIAATAARPLSGQAGAEVRGVKPSDDRYDGAGRLARVTPSKVGAPRYALLDGSGGVLYYVSPAPGVNMQYYVGHEVGVTGQQGYVADGGVTHIMAKHVTALDSQLR